MTLGFTQKINGKPNYFPEKIIMGMDIPDYKKFTLMDGLAEVVDETLEEFAEGSCNPFYPHKPKLHTIREDKNNRWKAGMDIHMVINNRTKNRFQFAPVVKCVIVQEVRITWSEDKSRPLDIIIGNTFYNPYGFTLKQLAINDGFDSVEDFFAYFDTDFKGKLIHWTDLKY